MNRDERENGLRMILNLGHTVGHAIEQATRYKVLLHGEAVGWGMIAALFHCQAARHHLAAAVSTPRKPDSSLRPTPGAQAARCQGRCRHRRRQEKRGRRPTIRAARRNRRCRRCRRRDARPSWKLPSAICCCGRGSSAPDAERRSQARWALRTKRPQRNPCAVCSIPSPRATTF